MVVKGLIVAVVVVKETIVVVVMGFKTKVSQRVPVWVGGQVHNGFVPIN